VLPDRLIQQRLQEVVSAVLPHPDLAIVLVRPCPDPKFGDYQTNALMALAKARKMNPRQLAADVLARLNLGDICERVEIAGAGFLNFKLKPATFTQTLRSAARGEHLFFYPASHPRTVVVDFSSPNVAKSMHVGHIRSTILGDSLSRTLRLLGHKVITDNHLGDWGTQFGMLLAAWKRDLNTAALKADPIAEMERLYKRISAECQTNPTTLETARQELVKLQRGNEQNLCIWREMISLSRLQFDRIYQRLGVTFDCTLGESFYHPHLASVVRDLQARDIARESEGAIAVFFEDIPQLKEHPALVQKSDGAFNYTTTDLATLAYRLETWHPDEIVYVTDARQQLHFQQLFALFRRWHPEAQTKLAHVWFGSILGDDGKPFKTRSGDTVKLSDLLDEADQRAYQVVADKNPKLSEAARREIARIVGVGAVKYADLLPNRQSDYVFSWDKLLALNGNTAPYLQYAYARIRSIFRKDETDRVASPGQPPQLPGTTQDSDALTLESAQELALARHLLNFGLVLEAVADDYRPNFLCNYLYDLAGHFTAFYENCPVLKSEARQRASRLVLCDLTARVLKQGLDVLGIQTLEQM
jgi:arginyl-tRNA synthetase